MVGTGKKVTTGQAFECWPTTVRYITQQFGANPDKYKQFGLPGHEGIDIAAPSGSAYFSVLPGTVRFIGDTKANGDPSNYGNYIVIDHGNGLTTLYAHASEDFLVAVGDSVDAGTPIAISGNSGYSTGYHLHLTVKQEGHQEKGWPPGYIDPLPFLKHLL